MTKVTIELKNCAQLEGSNTIGNGCPHCNTKLTKGYGYATDYMCGLKGNQVTSGYVEWASDMNPVPDWCPLRLDASTIASDKQKKLVDQISGEGI